MTSIPPKQDSPRNYAWIEKSKSQVILRPYNLTFEHVLIALMTALNTLSNNFSKIFPGGPRPPFVLALG